MALWSVACTREGTMSILWKQKIVAKHPKILMVTGIGVPDPIMGKIGRYYIIPNYKKHPIQDEIITYCKEHHENYKIPRQIVFRNELPLTPAGKIIKYRLLKEIEETIN